MEIKEFLPQLKEIISAFEELKKVDTNNIKPSYHAVELKNALRELGPTGYPFERFVGELLKYQGYQVWRD